MAAFRRSEVCESRLAVMSKAAHAGGEGRKAVGGGRKSAVVRSLSRISLSPNGADHDWASLSQDLLVNIFVQLQPQDRLAAGLACLTWHHAVVAPRCWEAMDGRAWARQRVLTAVLGPNKPNGGKGMAEEPLDEVLKECVWDLDPLAEASLSKFLSVGDRFMRKAVDLSCNELTEIKIAHCSFAGLAAVAISCPYLISLEVEEFMGDVNTALMAIAGKCASLQVLELSMSRFVNMQERVVLNAIVEALVAGCPELFSFSLRGCSMSHEQAVMMARGLPELRCIRAQLGGGWAHGEESTSLSDVFIALSENCPLIEVVDLRSSARVTDAALLTLLNDCDNLKSVRLAGDTVSREAMDKWGNLDSLSVSRLSFASALSPVEGGPSCGAGWLLTNLDLEGAQGDASLLAVATNCPNLRRLHLRNARDISDDAMKLLAATCPLLTDVDISGSEGLSDRSIEYLAEGCKHLESFNCIVDPLASNPSVFTLPAIEALISNCLNLHTLSINLPITKQTRRGMTREIFVALPTMMAIGNIGSNLKSLRVIGNNSMEFDDINAAIAVLADRCSNLTSLHLEGFGNLLDWALEALVLSNQDLVQLSIRGAHVSNAGAFCVAHLCQDLEYVDFQGTRVTADILSRFEEGWPRKQVLLSC